MLELIDIKKDYVVAGGAVHALKGVNIKFRKSEFVSVLGASGCGKTTLLNIIGGLDQYTSGDLIIEGKSTKDYIDRDWDTYRNHSVGFIFQSYHLIPHQTILQNVELALTIAGVDKAERKRRAIEALEKVGLGDKLNNRPNQLSGGQAQRVAIARALINDPEIVLADEPTGALDSTTSVQIMELLKEISRERLVIMVTHNPELAEQYSTRIVRLKDGELIGDSMPYDGAEDKKVEKQEVVEEKEGETDETKVNKGKKKRSSMSIGMAFMLSLKNLLSKRGRTAMISVAGSIGIIGVSMVLAISSGVQGFIASMENDMLSGFPLTVTETAIDYTSLMSAATSSGTKVDITKLDDKVYVNSLLDTLMDFAGSMTTNVITEEYVEYTKAMPAEYYNAIQFGYDFDMSNYIYTDHSVDGTPEKTENNSVTAIRAKYTSILKEQEEYKDYASMISTVSSFKEMPNNYNYILSQYDILATYDGQKTNLSEAQLKDMFESKDALAIVLNDNELSDLNYAQFGYMSVNEFLQFAYKAQGGEFDQSVIDSYNGKDFSYFCGADAKGFKWYPNDTVFQRVDMPNTPFTYSPSSTNFTDEDAVDLKVKVILQKKDGVSYGCLSSGIYYTEELTKHTLEKNINSEIVDYINNLEGEKVLPQLPYFYSYAYTNEKGEYKSGNASTVLYKLPTGNMFSMGGSIDTSEIIKVNAAYLAGLDLPTSIYIYPSDFKNKDNVTAYLDHWNSACSSGTFTFTNLDGETVTVEGLTAASEINYTDNVGLIISMVNNMITIITVALISFTALALVVSTVMVGIITYVSVVERIKEIGILRAVGARRKDIKRLFNAETFILGLAAGLVGVLVTYLLSLILNLVIGSMFGIASIAALPIWQAAIMVLVSVALTLVSGLIPASAAAKKDPVVALRTE